MGIFHQLVGWLGLLVFLGLSVAYIGVGATAVRKAKPIAGYLLIAGGVLGMLVSCCMSAVNVVDLDPDVRGMAGVVLGLSDLLHTVVHGACLIGAAVMLANAAKNDAPPGPG